MINVIVTFKLPKPVTRDEASRIFLSTAPKYQDVRGLVRKQYIVSDDGTTAGFMRPPRGVPEAGSATLMSGTSGPSATCRTEGRGLSGGRTARWW